MTPTLPCPGCIHRCTPTQSFYRGTKEEEEAMCFHDNRGGACVAGPSGACVNAGRRRSEDQRKIFTIDVGNMTYDEAIKIVGKVLKEYRK